MLFQGEYYEPMEYLDARIPELSYIRFFHASPDAPAIDIYINQRLVAKKLKYKSFTPYLGLILGNYTVEIYAAGTYTNPVIKSNINIPPKSIFTAAAINELANIQLYVIPDPALPPLSNMARLRFIHLSPNAPSVDFTLPNGMDVFPDVSYKEITSYKSFVNGRYTFQLRLAGTDTIVLHVPNILLRPARNLTAYAVGLTSSHPPLQMLIVMDGSTYLHT